MSHMGMRCRKHPSAPEPGGGICAVCLTERLAKIAQEENIAVQHAPDKVYWRQQQQLPVNLEFPALFNQALHEAPRRQPTLESFIGGKSRRSRRSSSSLLSLFGNVDQDSIATDMAENDQVLKINSRVSLSREVNEGFTDHHFGLSKNEEIFLRDEDKFNCVDFKEPKESSTNWFSSFLQRWSKRKHSSQRNSFSGRSSFESSRHSLDKILSKRPSSYYERELTRRQQALKAGGWEVQLQSPVDLQHSRRCRECDGHEEEMEMDYYSDSCSVLRKHRTALPLSNLFGKGSRPGNVNTHSAHACKDKKNARVANCILSAKNRSDMRAEVSGVEYSGRRMPAKSPLWKKPSPSCSTKDAGHLCGPGSSSFLMKPSPGHLCSMVNNNNPSNYSFFISPHRLPTIGSQCSSRGPNGKLN